MLGFGAGVMVAASFWSLLNPAIELCSELGYSQVMLPAIGFFAGGIFIILADNILNVRDKFDILNKYYTNKYLKKIQKNKNKSK